MAVGLAQHPHRGLHEETRVDEQRDGAFAEYTAEPLVVPLVHGEEGDPDHQRRRQQQVAEELGVEGCEAQAKRHPPADVEQRVAEGPEGGAGQRSPGEALDAEHRRQQESPRDDSGVVDERRRRLGAEATLRHQHRPQDSAADEEDLRGKDDAGEPNGQRLLLGPEARELEGHQRLGEPPEQRGRQQCDEAQGAEDGGEEAVGGLFSPFGENAGVEGNQGDRERADPQEVVEHVRDLEGSGVGVGVASDADLVGEHGIAYEGEDLGEKEARRQQCGGGGHAPPSGVATFLASHADLIPRAQYGAFHRRGAAGTFLAFLRFRSCRKRKNVKERPRALEARVEYETSEPRA